MFNLIESFIPNGFMQTTNILEMYDINGKPPTSTNYLYNVGSPSTDSSVTYTLSNKTANATLQIILHLPFYLTCDMGVNFLINSESGVTFTISFNENEVKKHGMGTYVDSVDISITPINYNKIVLLRIVPLVTPTPTPVVTPTPNPSSTPTVSGGKPILSWSTNPVYTLTDDPAFIGQYQYIETRNENYGTPYTSTKSLSFDISALVQMDGGNGGNGGGNGGITPTPTPTPSPSSVGNNTTGCYRDYQQNTYGKKYSQTINTIDGITTYNQSPSSAAAIISYTDGTVVVLIPSPPIPSTDIPQWIQTNSITVTEQVDSNLCGVIFAPGSTTLTLSGPSQLSQGETGIITATISDSNGNVISSHMNPTIPVSFITYGCVSNNVASPNTSLYTVVAGIGCIGSLLINGSAPVSDGTIVTGSWNIDVLELPATTPTPQVGGGGIGTFLAT